MAKAAKIITSAPTIPKAKRPDYYVYSTLTNGQRFVKYENMGNDLPVVVASVEINGGAGVARKQTLLTPYGVRTDISADQMDFLNQNAMFKKMVAGGWLTVTKATGWGVDPDAIAADMSQRDGSAPLVPADFSDKDRPTIGSTSGNVGTPPTTRPRTIPIRSNIGGFR